MRYNICDFRSNYRYRFLRTYDLGIAKHYDLNQINIPILDYIINNYNEGFIVDIGCGLGTFLSYLSFHINKKKLLGIDDLVK